MDLASKDNHEKMHQSPGSFECSDCKELFTSDSNFILHKQLVHKQFRCQLCDERFTDAESYNNHIKSATNCKERPDTLCRDCGVQFKSPAQLK